MLIVYISIGVVDKLYTLTLSLSTTAFYIATKPVMRTSIHNDITSVGTWYIPVLVCPLAKRRPKPKNGIIS